MVVNASVKRARALRRNASGTERRVWAQLRGSRLDGLKFRRQAPLGPYVLDFVCLRHRLIIEVDGPFHDPDHDAARDAFLKAKGFRVLRFSNDEVWSAPWRVAERVRALVQAGATPHPSRNGGHLLPQGEKGSG